MNAYFGRIAAGVVARVSLLLDLLLLAVMIGVSQVWSHHELSALLEPSALATCALLLLAWLIVGMALRQYDPWASERALPDDLAMVSILVMAVTTTLALAMLVVPRTSLPSLELFLVAFWPTALILRAGVFRAFSEHEGPIDEVLVVGAGPLARATADDIERRRRHHVLGYLRFSNDTVPTQLRGRVLGAVDQLARVLEATGVAEVYLASTSPRDTEEIQNAIRACERFGVPFALPAYTYRLTRARPLDSHGVGDGYIHYQSVVCKPTQMAMKRLFDIAVSAVAVWLALPFLLLVAAAIKATSKGPLFFNQTRVGLHGRPFRMLKFRTMVNDAEAKKAALMALNEQDGPAFKMAKDPRVTPVGRVLRKFSIDELPQLINVLRGDMSLVGPRPALPNEVSKYEGWQRRRLSVRPGLTCIWQISGRNLLSFEQWMFMDMQYIDNWTFGMDLSIILRTVPVVLTGKGAS